MSRRSALQTVSLEGIDRDVTPIPHNGCRPPKRESVNGSLYWSGLPTVPPRAPKLFLKGALLHRNARSRSNFPRTRQTRKAKLAGYACGCARSRR